MYHDDNLRERAAAVSIESIVDRYNHMFKLRRRGRELVGPCPLCGDGDDRFQVNLRKGKWCNGHEGKDAPCGHSGGGKVLDLVAFLEDLESDGPDFPNICRITLGEPEPTERSRYEHQRREFRVDPQRLNGGGDGGDHDPDDPTDVDDYHDLAMGTWGAAGELAGTMGWDYLIRPENAGGRGFGAYTALLETVSERALRFHPACPWEKATAPAIVALYRNIETGAPQAILRIALQPDGTKLDRMSLGPTKGSAVELTPRAEVKAARKLHIAEAVETGLAAMALGFTPAWAVASANGIREFPLMPLDELGLLLDHDESRTSQKAGAKCWDRYHRYNIKNYTSIKVVSYLPDNVGEDFNDIVMRMRR